MSSRLAPQIAAVKSRPRGAVGTLTMEMTGGKQHLICCKNIFIKSDI